MKKLTLSLLTLGTLLIALIFQAPALETPMSSIDPIVSLSRPSLAVHLFSSFRKKGPHQATALAPTEDRLDLTNPPTTPVTGATKRAIDFSDDKHA